MTMTFMACVISAVGGLAWVLLGAAQGDDTKTLVGVAWMCLAVLHYIGGIVADIRKAMGEKGR